MFGSKRTTGKPDILRATERGDLTVVWDHLAADASCVGRLDPL